MLTLVEVNKIYFMVQTVFSDEVMRIISDPKIAREFIHKVLQLGHSEENSKKDTATVEVKAEGNQVRKFDIVNIGILVKSKE